VGLPLITVGIPVRYHDGDVDPDVRKCIDAMIGYGHQNKLYDIAELRWGGMSISQNSYKLIRAFLNDERFKHSTHLLYTGDDLTFPPDALAMLLSENKPVIVGCATWKTPPYFVNCTVLDRANKESKIFVTREMLEKGIVAQVYAAGSGFMLIRRDVLKDVHNFWKDYHKVYQSVMPKRFLSFEPVPYFPVAYDGAGFISTDYAFCNAVRECGHTIWLHCGAVIGHIWKKQFSVIDHVNWRDRYGMAVEEPAFPTQKIESVEYVQSKPGMEDQKIGIAAT